MSLAGLVDYGSSDDSENEVMDEIPANITKEKLHSENKKLNLPEPGNCYRDPKIEDISRSSSRLNLSTLPKPKSTAIDEIDEEEVSVPVAKQFLIEKSTKKERAPVRISIPSLSDFEDLDAEENKNKNTQNRGVKKSAGVLALLPAPKSDSRSAVFIPHVLKKSTPTTALTPTQIKMKTQNNINSKKASPKIAQTNNVANDDDDDDEDDISANANKKSIDFFSLSQPKNIPISEEVIEQMKIQPETSTSSQVSPQCEEAITNSLTSTVLNLGRDEILLKNKAEVGPKLPVPEQEFHIDAAGNVAFDDKAIEYLCGKRGVKRKEMHINEADIIDINGEDIKPDEREWLVKALTEEPVQRPVSIGSGPGSQSKKKHQITYLAHQAKAMEIELKNQWAENRMARKQTQSKYGF